MANIKHLVIYSGGMDSFTLLHFVRHGILTSAPDASRIPGQLDALSFTYNQRHSRELKSAWKVTGKLGINHRVLDLPILAGVAGSALTDKETAVPEGHYAAENMRKTVVPGRNTLFLASALSMAEALLLQPEAPDQVNVYYGAHAGDHDIYPDCRRSYVRAMQEVFHEATEGRVNLVVPFIDYHKADILLTGARIGLSAADYVDTWTCYKGGEKACGKCGSCVERLEAFDKLGWIDPLDYEDREFYKQALAGR